MPPVIKLESISSEPPVEITQVEGGIVSFGRGTDNHVVVDSEAVSRRHGCLIGTDHHWVFRDFESTNGSWVNGVKLVPGQYRLVRHGDVIQLADFPMKVVDVNHVPDMEAEAMPTVLVFYNDHFEAEIPLEDAESIFAVGGPSGAFFVEGAPSELPQLEIVHNGWRVELTVGPNALPVIVNGMAARGVTALSDRDEVAIDAYRVIVNDIRSAAQPETVRPKAKGQGEKAVQAYGRKDTPEHLLRTSQQSIDWESEAAKRRALSGKKFVFGSEPEMEETTATMGIARQRYSGGTGFEMSVSQRFSASVADAENRRPSPLAEMLLTIFGMIIFLVIIGLLVWFFFLVE
jgi:hypothetical protein